MSYQDLFSLVIIISSHETMFSNMYKFQLWIEK